MIDLLIVDDQDLIRDGLRAILVIESGIRVVGEASDGAQAVRLCQRLAPQVVLMDLRMPIMDGIQATREITQNAPAPYVLVLTTYDDDDNVLGALRAGASGFLLKETPRARIVEAVHRVAQGEAQLAPELTRRLIHKIKDTPSPPSRARLPAVSPREIDILRGVARGRSNSEIADQLSLSVTTVKSYASSLFAKLGVRDRVQATVVAYETGLVTPGVQDP